MDGATCQTFVKDCTELRNYVVNMQLPCITYLVSQKFDIIEKL